MQEMCQTSRTYVCTCNCNAALRGDGAAYIYIYIYMLIHIYCPSRCAASLFSLTAINPGWGSGPFFVAEMRKFGSSYWGQRPILGSMRNSAADFEAPAAPNP